MWLYLFVFLPLSSVLSCIMTANSWHSPGRAGGLVGCGHSKLACVCLYWVAADYCSIYKSDGSTSRKSVTKLFFCKGLWSWNLDTRSSSVFDVFSWSPYWKWARIDRVKCCRRSRNRRLYLKGGSGGTTIAMWLVKLKIDDARQDLADKRPTLASIATKE